LRRIKVRSKQKESGLSKARLADKEALERCLASRRNKPQVDVVALLRGEDPFHTAVKQDHVEQDWPEPPTKPILAQEPQQVTQSLKKAEKQTPEKKTSKNCPSRMIGPSEKTDGISIVSNFLKVANPIILDIQKNLDGTAYKLYLRLVMLSWGYNRNWCAISAPSLAEGVGTGTSHVKKALLSLESLGYIKASRFRYGKEVIVFLPEGSEIKRSEKQTSENQASEKQTSENQASEKQTFRRLKNAPQQQRLLLKDNKELPLYPPLKRGTTKQLKIETGRWPRKPVDWEPWEGIRTRLQESFSYEEFRPLSRVTMAARGLGRSIYIRGDGLTPEVLSNSLTRALEAELLACGIHTLRIAV
jgi:hypothetical protein